MEQLILNPTSLDIDRFRAQLFEDKKILFVTDKDLKKVRSRFIKPNEFLGRAQDYNHLIKFVKLDTTIKNFLYQIQKPCVDTKRFIAYRFGRYGVILNKCKGNIICLVEDENLNMVTLDDQKLLLKMGNNEKVTILRNGDNFSINSSSNEDGVEIPVEQDNEWAKLHDPKEGLISWDVWVCEFLRSHNE